MHRNRSLRSSRSFKRIISRAEVLFKTCWCSVQSAACKHDVWTPFGNVGAFFSLISKIFLISSIAFISYSFIIIIFQRSIQYVISHGIPPYMTELLINRKLNTKLGHDVLVSILTEMHSIYLHPFLSGCSEQTCLETLSTLEWNQAFEQASGKIGVSSYLLKCLFKVCMSVR